MIKQQQPVAWIISSIHHGINFFPKTRQKLGLFLIVYDWISGNLVGDDWRDRRPNSDPGLHYHEMWLGWRGGPLYVLASMIFFPCSWKCISTICDPCRSSIRCLCCFFAGEDSKYENAEMGRLKIKLLDQYRCTLLPRHVRGTLELSNDQGNSR